MSAVAMSDADPLSIPNLKSKVYAPNMTAEAAAEWKARFGQEVVGYATTVTTTTTTSTSTPFLLSGARRPPPTGGGDFKVPAPRKPKPKPKPKHIPVVAIDDDDDDFSFAVKTSVAAPNSKSQPPPPISLAAPVSLPAPAAASAGALIEKPAAQPGETAAPIGQNMNTGTVHESLFDPRYQQFMFKELQNSETRRHPLPLPIDTGSTRLVVDGQLNVRCRSTQLRDVLLHLDQGIRNGADASREIANVGIALVPLEAWNNPDSRATTRYLEGGPEQHARDKYDKAPIQWMIDGARQSLQRTLPSGAHTPLTNIVLNNLIVKCFGSPGAAAAALDAAKASMDSPDTAKSIEKDFDVKQFQCHSQLRIGDGPLIGPYRVVDLELNDALWPLVPPTWLDPKLAMFLSLISPPVLYREAVLDKQKECEVFRIWRVPLFVTHPTPHTEIQYIVCPKLKHREIRAMMQKHPLFSAAETSPNALHLFDEKANLRPLQAAFYCSWEACEFRLSMHSMFHTAIPLIVKKMGHDGDLVEFLKNPDRADKFDQNAFYALPLFFCMALGWGNHELRLTLPSDP